VLIFRRSKLYYTAYGIIKPVGGRPVQRLREESSLKKNLCIKLLNYQDFKTASKFEEYV